LWEIYYPSRRCVYTFSEDDMSGPQGVWEGGDIKPLGEQDWIGPDYGPYHILGYQWIPGNPFPKGPVQDIVELHEAINETYRKLVRQTARQKTVTVYQREFSDDSARIQKANDGDLVGVSSPQAVQELAMGGPNQGAFLFMKEMFDRMGLMAGNLLTMGGLAPQANTLGQEELLNQQSNGQIASMQDVTTSFVSKVASSMLWFHWHDPRTVQRTKLEGLNVPGLQLTRKIHPWTEPDASKLRRVGEMPQLKIDPYSLRSVTPAQRAQDLTQVVTQIYLPMAQMAERSGVTLDFNAFLSLMAKYRDNPDIQSILTVQEPPAVEGSSQGSMAPEGAGMPQETTRNYVRRSLGGGSHQAQQAGMDSLLQGSANGFAGPLQKA